MDYIFEGKDLEATLVLDNDEQKEVTVRKKPLKTKKIMAYANYSKPSQNKTSISYIKDNKKCSVFISGIYSGEIEIEYTGKEFLAKNIISVR